MIAIGVVGLVLTYEAPRIWAYFRRHNEHRMWFLAAFESTAHARSYLRTYAAQKYAKERNSEWPQKFRNFVACASIPKALPLSAGDSLLDWSQRQALELDQESSELYYFAMKCYSPDAVQCIDRQLDDSRRHAAKFWDKAGLQLEQGQLRLEDISTPLKSAAAELKFLVFLELAKTRQEAWDEGPSKRGLFYVAHQAERIVKHGP